MIYTCSLCLPGVLCVFKFLLSMSQSFCICYYVWIPCLFFLVPFPMLFSFPSVFTLWFLLWLILVFPFCSDPSWSFSFSVFPQCILVAFNKPLLFRSCSVDYHLFCCAVTEDNIRSIAVNSWKLIGALGLITITLSSSKYYPVVQMVIYCTCRNWVYCSRTQYTPKRAHLPILPSSLPDIRQDTRGSR